MNIEIEATQTENIAAKKSSGQIVFFTATCSTLLGILYLIGLAGKLIVDGTIHSSSSPTVQIASAIIAILWNLSLLIMFVALRRQFSGRNAVFAELAMIFMTLVCAISSINWFVQLTIVPKIVEAGEPTILALVDVHNDLSVTYAMEHLGWGVFYGITAIFAAIAMSGDKLERWIRWLFVAGGVLSLLHVIGIITTDLVLSDLGYMAWGMLLPVTTTLLALRYRKQ
jgi:hypothetical protein